MLDGVRTRFHAAIDRLHRFERRELREFRAWIENTRNLIHVTILVVVPLLIGGVAWLSNTFDPLPFLLFPPLASGTYTLFAHPEERYASPRRFVGGLTTGAVCGWVALELSARYWYQVDTASVEVHAGAAAFGVFLTGLVTWALDMEEASAYSSALLVLVADVVGDGPVQLLGATVSSPATYVLGVFLSSSLVAGVFLLWRNRFYERRARYLYQSTKGDDRVLVPIRGDDPESTAMLGARLAAAHEAGKVVLLSLVDPSPAQGVRESGTSDSGRGPSAQRGDGSERVSGASVDRADDGGADTDAPSSESAAAIRAASSVESLERQARRIETRVGVPCQVLVAEGTQSPAAMVSQAADETNCDLICTPYETQYSALAPFVRQLFAGGTDVLVHRSATGTHRWRRVLVPVRRSGDVAHSMVDFATRLAGATGHVAVCHCIATERRRRSAERMLADLVETVDAGIETRVARTSIETFLAETADQYDLVIIGASTDRTAASRFVSPPTFERIRDVDCDVAILDRNLGV